jgi:ribosomal protein S18 acetylase RimI-like enzyme
VATLVRRLVVELDVVGLNVREANTEARRFYARLGLEEVAPYTEAELVARPVRRGRP